MQYLLFLLMFSLGGCGSSSLADYCAKQAECLHADCRLSTEACDELRQGERTSCEAELSAIRNIFEGGTEAACESCVVAMDRYHACAAAIPTCTDFEQDIVEDCDGEYTEYTEACSPAVREACGGATTDTGGTQATRETGITLTTPTTTPPTLLIDLVQSGCDKDGWFYYSETSAWTGDAIANVWEVRDDGHGWNEEHSVPSVDFDPQDDSYDILERTLADGAAVGDYTEDVNTVFQCGVHDQTDAEGMTYTLRVYDTDLNYADCAAWGVETTAVLADPSGTTPSVPGIIGVTDAHQISADNCVVF